MRTRGRKEGGAGKTIQAVLGALSFHRVYQHGLALSRIPIAQVRLKCDPEGHEGGKRYRSISGVGTCLH